MLPGGGFLGLADTGKLRVLRYDSAGRLDATFNGGKPLEFNFGFDYASPGTIVANADGSRFAVVATVSSSDPYQLAQGAIAMFNADGTLVRGFGRRGSAFLKRGEAWTYLRAAVFQKDKLLVAGASVDTLRLWEVSLPKGT